MLIIKASNTAIIYLLQVFHAHQIDANSITSNTSTFWAQTPSNFESYTPNSEIDTPGTRRNNLDLEHDILSNNERISTFRETSTAIKLSSLITSQVRFKGNTPYVHLGLNLDDIVPENTVFDPQAIILEIPTAPKPNFQKNFYYPISDQVLSTIVDLISMTILDDLLLEFSSSSTKVPVDPIELNYAQLNQENDLDNDSYTLDFPGDNDDFYQENFESFSQFDDDMSQKTPFSQRTYTVHSL